MLAAGAFADGEAQPLDGLQDIEIPAGGRTAVKLSGHTGLERLSLVVESDGPIVAERGLYRIAGRGIAQSIGIPLAVDVVVPDPLNG